MVTHSEIEEVRKALGKIDQLTNLLDVPEKPKNPLSPSHSYVAVKIRKIIQKLLLVGFGDCAKLREAALAIRADILKRRSENCWYATDSDILEKIDAALAAPPRNCDKLSAEECKRIFAKEMTIYLPPEATDKDRTIATLTANGVIDALYAIAQAGGYDGSK